MGLFSKSKEEKEREKKEREEKAKESFDRLGIDFDSYSDEEIKEKIKKEFTFIGSTFPLDAMGELLANFGMTSHQRIQLMKLTEMISQNWILIRQNELIIRLLEKKK